MHRFSSRLNSNAFIDEYIETTNYQLELQGWIDDHLEKVIDSVLDTFDVNQPFTMIEVGTWKGLSTSKFASAIKAKGFKDVELICIDTWLGAPEFWTEKGINDKDRGVALNLVNGYPTVYKTFLKNMKKLGHEDIICPFPISSNEGYHVLKSYGIKADLVYIDAAHEYEAVKKDMELYAQLLKPKGVLMGDDYDLTGWPGVVKAVTEFYKPIKTKGRVWFTL